MGPGGIPQRAGLQPWALHLIASQVNCPLAEWVVVGNPGEENPFARSILLRRRTDARGRLHPPSDARHRHFNRSGGVY